MVPLHRHRRADRPAIGLEVLDELGVDGDVVHAAAEDTLREPAGATRITLLVSPPMKKLLTWGPVAGSRPRGNVKRSVASAKAVKFVALPPIRMSPICPVETPPPTSETRYVPPGRQAGRRRRSGWRTGWATRPRRCGVAVDLVGLEQVDPPVDHEGDALLEDSSWCRTWWTEAASVITLSMMMLVPLWIGGPEVDHELVVLLGLIQGRAAGGGERRVNAAEAKRVDPLRRVDPAGQLERRAAEVPATEWKLEFCGRCGRVRMPQPEVRHVHRRDAVLGSRELWARPGWDRVARRLPVVLIVSCWKKTRPSEFAGTEVTLPTSRLWDVTVPETVIVLISSGMSWVSFVKAFPSGPPRSSCPDRRASGSTCHPSCRCRRRWPRCGRER